jgi:rhodanese-related sulfurtransferase
MVTQAKARVENLSVEQVEGELADGALLVDIREEDERRTNGTIPGAIHAARGMLEFYADPATPYYKPDLKPEARIILHCAAGSRSALATATLQDMGYTNVAHLESGFRGWSEAGKPVEKG